MKLGLCGSNSRLLHCELLRIGPEVGFFGVALRASPAEVAFGHAAATGEVEFTLQITSRLIMFDPCGCELISRHTVAGLSVCETRLSPLHGCAIKCCCGECDFKSCFCLVQLCDVAFGVQPCNRLARRYFVIEIDEHLGNSSGQLRADVHREFRLYRANSL